MVARIFISYRTSDGMDKATALARDLGRVFGDDQVFIDKSDLRGGAPWREDVQSALDQRPVLLLLVTPLLLGAVDEHGAPRVQNPDDPVRRELEGALRAGAQIIPVLCDGVAAVPDTRLLPEAFRQINERTWRRLRAYDWPADVERLVGDLREMGVPPVSSLVPAPSPEPASSPAPLPPRRRSVTWALVSVALLLAAGLAAALWWQRAANADPLAGEWLASVESNPPFTLVLKREGERLTLTSGPIAIATLPEWAAYRQFWRERGGGELDQVILRGEGTVREVPGVPPAIDVAVRTLSQPGETPVDSGNLSATLAADGRALSGRLWSNGDQADRPIALRRPVR